MFEKILCPIDGSDHGAKALGLAIDLAKSYDAELIFMHGLLRHANAEELRRFADVEHLTKTVDPEISRLRALAGQSDYGSEEKLVTSRICEEIGKNILDNAKFEAEARGLNKVKTILADSDVAAQIMRCIEKDGVDCVLMGSRGLSDVTALFLGSVSHKVWSRVPCTCIVVK